MAVPTATLDSHILDFVAVLGAVASLSLLLARSLDGR